MCARLLLFVLASAPPTAPAPDNPALARAQTHLEALAYGEALEALDEALEVPGNEREVLLRILALRAVTAAALDQQDEAVASFRTLLSLDPQHTLEREYAPRIRAAFDDGRAWVDQHGALSFTPTTLEEERRARVVVDRDALGLARQVRFHLASAEGSVDPVVVELVDGRAELAVPAHLADGGWWAELLGARDAVLARAGGPAALFPLPKAQPVAAIAPGLPSPAPAPAPLNAPKYRPIAYGLFGTAGAALLSGVFFGARSQSARTQLTGAQTDSQGRIVGLTQVQAHALEARSQREAVTANVLLGAAAGLALAGGGLWWWGGRVAVTPTPNGVSVGGTLP